jgi:hypothetical protein
MKKGECDITLGDVTILLNRSGNPEPLSRAGRKFLSRIKATTKIFATKK